MCTIPSQSARRFVAAVALLAAIPALIAPVELWHLHGPAAAHHPAVAGNSPCDDVPTPCTPVPTDDGGNCAVCLIAHASFDIPEIAVVQRVTLATPAALPVAPTAWDFEFLRSHFARGPPA